MYLIQLNEKQKLECLKLKEYSEYLLSKNFPNIETRLHHIRKTINGYSFICRRNNSNNKYKINLNLITNKIEINRSIY